MNLRHDMLVHGVYIVTASHQGRVGGLSIAWATQVARDQVLICVGGQSASRDLILKSQAFGLNILRKDQVALAHSFGRSSIRERDKFAGIAYQTADTGAPLLDDCAVSLDCKVEAIFDYGDSKLIVGRVVSILKHAEQYEPLIYRQEDYD
jgi:flavin reductase (DIM6/NTAB) family NADH-FMN oxidoreductase RutF